jgi:trehalose 6-phosphate synthase
MTRLVVVSNRVGDPTCGPPSGGLSVAVAETLRRSGGLWFGWNGEIAETSNVATTTWQSEPPVTNATLPLSAEEYEGYYLGFSNRVLWPVFHYRPDLVEFERSFYDIYRRVNVRFAAALTNLLRPNDAIWVHDYHLIPLGLELRRLGVNQPIGFFLHIPFPPTDVIVAAPRHAWIRRSLLAYDVVGFQTDADASNFISYTEQHGVEHLGDGELQVGRRRVLAKAFPVGIDVDSFRTMAISSDAAEHIARMQRHATVRKHIIGVDRLDYTKGLSERLRAFGQFLDDYPDQHKSVTLTQIASPTREDLTAYANIRSELAALSGAINGQYGDYDWTPIRYIHRNVPRSTLAALFRGSDVGLVTPLRDGMNLVAKEYVASQDEENPGVLVLSRFAGAAEKLTEAIIVHPYDIGAMAKALRQALTMSREERRERHRALLIKIRESDVHAWSKFFISVLTSVRNPGWHAGHARAAIDPRSILAASAKQKPRSPLPADPTSVRAVRAR